MCLCFQVLYEGFSRAIVEAMASRLPIVCTSVGVAADALRHEHSALIVPTRDAGALVAAVERLRADSGLRRTARRRAPPRRPAVTRWPTFPQRTIDVLIDAARGPR